MMDLVFCFVHCYVMKWQFCINKYLHLLVMSIAYANLGISSRAFFCICLTFTTHMGFLRNIVVQLSMAQRFT